MSWGSRQAIKCCLLNLTWLLFSWADSSGDYLQRSCLRWNPSTFHHGWEGLIRLHCSPRRYQCWGRWGTFVVVATAEKLSLLQYIASQQEGWARSWSCSPDKRCKHSYWGKNNGERQQASAGKTARLSGQIQLSLGNLKGWFIISWFQHVGTWRYHLLIWTELKLGEMDMCSKNFIWYDAGLETLNEDATDTLIFISLDLGTKF